MTKILNPGIRKLAGRRHIATVAQIRHRGRRSQRAYVTPVSARRSGTLFLVPLTFGNQSDWCLNVLSAGGCTIRWRGEDFETSTPTLIDRKAADPAMLRAAFKPHERLMFRVLGIKQFLKVNVVAPASPVNR